MLVCVPSPLTPSTASGEGLPAVKLTCVCVCRRAEPIHPLFPVRVNSQQKSKPSHSPHHPHRPMGCRLAALSPAPRRGPREAGAGRGDGGNRLYYHYIINSVYKFTMHLSHNENRTPPAAAKAASCLFSAPAVCRAGAGGPGRRLARFRLLAWPPLAFSGGDAQPGHPDRRSLINSSIIIAIMMTSKNKSSNDTRASAARHGGPGQWSRARGPVDGDGIDGGEGARHQQQGRWRQRRRLSFDGGGVFDSDYGGPLAEARAYVTDNRIDGGNGGVFCSREATASNAGDGHSQQQVR